ncbi:MAG: hypothetical protein MR450_00855 [Prevotella sp.]|nr:hypothetical protein [Prevotella sp.]MDY4038083.1 hypothetical protein [Prevotella sp.]
MTEELQQTSHQHSKLRPNTHHHRHGCHRHRDEAEIFKNKQLNAKARRRIIARIMFIILSILAICIMAFVVWIYTAE